MKTELLTKSDIQVQVYRVVAFEGNYFSTYIISVLLPMLPILPMLAPTRQSKIDRLLNVSSR